MRIKFAPKAIDINWLIVSTVLPKMFVLTCIEIIFRPTVYDWAAGRSCVLGFFSGELDVGSEMTKLYIVYHDDITAYFDPWSNIIQNICTVMYLD